MKNFPRCPLLKLLFILLITFGPAYGQTLDDYNYENNFDPGKNAVYDEFQLNGNTNYWHDTYEN